MNINERLQEIEEGLDNDIHGRLIMSEEDYQWMRDTIKQLQDDNVRLNLLYNSTYKSFQQQDYKIELQQKTIAELEETRDYLNSVSGIQQQRIDELEKERREITAAHEAFLDDLTFGTALNIKTEDGKVWREITDLYNNQFASLHLAEQVRLAKLSAGVDGE